ncbi:hypothetical protein [Paenirhodobacter sp.]|uniref:hypothetical protein n=1 Tax=Paenirhodobacter sp. TaxID=1965326 RepID=UPI003B3FD708
MQPTQDVFAALPAERAEIAEMSRAACRAVLTPAAPGGLSLPWRHAVAARICAKHGQDALAVARLAGTDDDTRALADPGFAGRDARERAVLAFVDGVAVQPRTVTAEDLAGLKAAGVADADIVRLCELAAYLAYECRVAAGLALMQGGR